MVGARVARQSATIGRSAASRTAIAASAVAARARASARRWLAATARPCASSSDRRSRSGDLRWATSHTRRQRRPRRHATPMQSVTRVLVVDPSWQSRFMTLRSFAVRRAMNTSSSDGGSGHLGAQARRLVARQDAALVQQRDAAAPLGLVQVGRGHQDRDAARQELRQQLPELAPRHRIDAGRRLVEQDQLGLVDQRAGQRQLLLHAAGQPSASRARNGVSCVISSSWSRRCW